VRRRVVRFAVAVTVLTGLILVAAALRDPAAGRWLAAAAACAGTVVAVWLQRTPAPAALLRVAGDGAIWWRRSVEDEPLRAQGLFQSPWLVVLGIGGRAVDVWFDQLGMDAFRRLSACLRWQVARAGVARNSADVI
jgi:hypothetical protein